MYAAHLLVILWLADCYSADSAPQTCDKEFRVDVTNEKRWEEGNANKSRLYPNSLI